VTTLAIVLAAIAAYLTAGAAIARRHLPRAWAKARDFWCESGNIRGSVKAQTIAMFLLWPVMLAGLAVTGRLDHVIDAADPVMLARKIGERDRRIAQLEREAGIRP
jgi:hypothetical protein